MQMVLIRVDRPSQGGARRYALYYMKSLVNKFTTDYVWIFQLIQSQGGLEQKNNSTWGRGRESRKG